MSGTALAQLIPILLQPVLRRYYSPETFGAYSVYLSIIGILYVLSSLRYEMAIVLPKSDKTAVNLLVLSQIFNLLFNSILLIIILFFNDQILSFINLSREYRILLYLVPLGTFLYNFYQSNHYWLIRKKAFKAVSVNKFARRLAEGTVQISIKSIMANTGLLIGDIIGHLVNCLSGIYQSSKHNFKIANLSKNRLKYVFKKYDQFPKYNLLSSFMGVFCFLVPTILINKFYSSEYAGLYDLSKMVLSIPLALIAGSIANVLLQRFSEKKQKNISIWHDFKNMFLFVFIIATLEIVLITFWGVKLFSVIFGKQWVESGIMSKTLVWPYAINFLVFSFSSVFISLEKIKLLSVWQALRFVAILALFFLDYLNFEAFIRVYVVIEMFSFMVNFILLIYIIKKYEYYISTIKKE